MDTLKFFLIYISFLNIYLQQASVLVEMWSLFSFALSNLQLSLVLIYDIYTVYDIRYTISSSTSFSNKSPALSFCAIFAFHIFVLVTSFIRSPTQKRGFYLLRRCDGICEKLQSSLVGCNRALFFVFFLQIKVDFHDLLDFKNLGLFVQDFRRKSDKFNCSK